MGKSRRPADGPAVGAEEVFSIDLRTAFHMPADERAQWLSKACRAASEGTVRVSQLFDVVCNEKFVSGVSDKVGLRMKRTVMKYLEVFSERQQKHLRQSAVMVSFKIEDEHAQTRYRSTKAASVKSSGDEDAASRMEEMMARCRAFVREKATTYDERAAEVERASREAEERELADRRACEWQQIDLWHRQMEPWENEQMVAQDILLQYRAQQAKDKEGKKDSRRGERRKESHEGSSRSRAMSRRRRLSGDRSLDKSAGRARGRSQEERERGSGSRASSRSRSTSRGRRRRWDELYDPLRGTGDSRPK